MPHRNKYTQHLTHSHTRCRRWTLTCCGNVAGPGWDFFPGGGGGGFKPTLACLFCLFRKTQTRLFLKVDITSSSETQRVFFFFFTHYYYFTLIWKMMSCSCRLWAPASLSDRVPLAERVFQPRSLKESIYNHFRKKKQFTAAWSKRSMESCEECFSSSP